MTGKEHGRMARPALLKVLADGPASTVALKLGAALMALFALGFVFSELGPGGGYGSPGGSVSVATGVPYSEYEQLEEHHAETEFALKRALTREQNLRKRLEGFGVKPSAEEEKAALHDYELLNQGRAPAGAAPAKPPPPAVPTPPTKAPPPAVAVPSLPPHPTATEPVDWLPKAGSPAAKLTEVLKPFAKVRPPMGLAGTAAGTVPGKRPAWKDRHFTSPVVEYVVREVSTRMRDEGLAMMFANCFPNTLDTTVDHFSEADPDAFVITGDIPAQWLRDSTNQVLPYVPFARDDPRLGKMLCGLVRRQGRDVLYDPYANAFCFADKCKENRWQTDRRVPKMRPHLHEGKYELDSLCALLKLSHRYFKHTGDLGCFDDGSWRKAVALAMDTIEEQMKGTDEEGSKPAYVFERAYGDLKNAGRGPAGKRTGMSKCGFRPSDDHVDLPFLVPANAMAVVELRHAAEIFDAMGDAEAAKLAARARGMAKTIDEGIKRHALVKDPSMSDRKRFAYEVDGEGRLNHMDDANIPSLLSLPYLGYSSRSDPDYVATREFVLSKRNPWYMEGTVPPGVDVQGVGGPHIGRGYVWPMSIVMRALTSQDDDEIRKCLQQIKASNAGTGLLHESFYIMDARRFTRSWFAWVNTLFGELILQLARERPHLIF